MDEVKKAYDWAINQQHQSVAARYAKVLATELAALRAALKRVEEERDKYLQDALFIFRELVAEHADLTACREELAKVKAENEEWEQTFDLTYKADLRGIEMFRKAHPEYAEQLKLPSTDKLIFWLLEKLARYERAMEPVRECREKWRGCQHAQVVMKERDCEAWEACKDAIRLLDSGKVTESVTKGE